MVSEVHGDSSLAIILRWLDITQCVDVIRYGYIHPHHASF
jgi:hypothetical protein